MRGPAVIYVGNLPNDIKERELQELFEKASSRSQTMQTFSVQLPTRLMHTLLGDLAAPCKQPLVLR